MLFDYANYFESRCCITKEFLKAVSSHMNVFFKSANVGFSSLCSFQRLFRNQFIRLLAAFKKLFMTVLCAGKGVCDAP